VTVLPKKNGSIRKIKNQPMKNRPVAAKIILPLTQSTINGELFIGLSTSLYTQNLIFDEPRTLRKKDSQLELIVVFQDRKSFEQWTFHPVITEQWNAKFEAGLSASPITIEEEDLIITVDEVENCSCTSSYFYLLQGRSFNFVDELVCGNCLKHIPYSIVHTSIRIEAWQRYHERFYRTWLESGLFEEEALKELTNYKDGKLNQEGERIRSQLEAHFQRPVYLLYFAEEPDLRENCLLCGQGGEDSGLKNPAKFCPSCRAAF
jgi:hypothetical protein